MTCIHSFMLTGEATETPPEVEECSVGTSGMLAYYPVERYPFSSHFFPYTCQNLCLIQGISYPLSRGWGREAVRAEPQVVQGFAKLFVSS